MSLREDFSNYFRGTFIGIKQEDGTLLPFRVDGVRDTGNFHSSDYSDAHKTTLVFEGLKYNPRTRRGEESTISVVDPNLVLETPEIGYYRSGNGRIRWVRYKAAQNRLKGVHSQRLVGLSVSLNLPTVYSLFNPSFEGLINKHLYISPITGVVYYKGIAIGKKIDNRINLLRKWQHINSLLRDFELQVVDSVEFPTNGGRRDVAPTEAVAVENNPFLQEVAQVFSDRSTLEPRPVSRAASTPQNGSSSSQEPRSPRQQDLDRQRGFRSNGMPVLMDNESFSSFSSRLDNYFASRN